MRARVAKAYPFKDPETGWCVRLMIRTDEEFFYYEIPIGTSAEFGLEAIMSSGRIQELRKIEREKPTE